jgi:hypothetical protein
VIGRVFIGTARFDTEQWLATDTRVPVMALKLTTEAVPASFQGLTVEIESDAEGVVAQLRANAELHVDTNDDGLLDLDSDPIATVDGVSLASASVGFSGFDYALDGAADTKFLIVLTQQAGTVLASAGGNLGSDNSHGTGPGAGWMAILAMMSLLLAGAVRPVRVRLAMLTLGLSLTGACSFQNLSFTLPDFAKAKIIISSNDDVVVTSGSDTAIEVEGAPVESAEFGFEQ